MLGSLRIRRARIEMSVTDVMGSVLDPPVAKDDLIELGYGDRDGPYY